jgi:drug/metabolite transporter (DMT)-like permease
MPAIALALGASLVYGASDFLGGLKSRTVALLPVLLVSQGTALVVLLAFVSSFGGPPPTAEFLGYAGLAGVAEAVGVAALYRGLASGVMSVVAPVAAAAPVVPVAVGILLGELPSSIQAAGLVFAVVGIVVVSRERSAASAASTAVAASVTYGLLAAIGFGAFFVAMDAASEGSVPWALTVSRATAVSIFAAAMLATRTRLDVPPAELPSIALIGVLVIAADSLYAIASTHGLLSIVAVLSSLYPIVTIGLARLYLNERIDRLRQAGIAAVLVGVVAISAA